MNWVSGRILAPELPRSVALGMLLELRLLTCKIGIIHVYLIGSFSGIDKFMNMKCLAQGLIVLTVQLT